jgi:peptidoglycan hydrolase-like protein with peptidoglycan-binding domain
MTPPTVQVGSKGPAVQQAQQALLDRGYAVGPPGADGIFGIHTPGLRQSRHVIA